MRISDWSSDVCSSDLVALVEIRLELRRVSQLGRANRRVVLRMREQHDPFVTLPIMEADAPFRRIGLEIGCDIAKSQAHVGISVRGKGAPIRDLRHGEFKTYAKTISRSEEHTSELQSLMSISYAVFCLKNKTTNNPH